MATRKEIYDAVDDVKEFLALNKWNDAMKLMAQISIEVIENLTDEALIVSKGYDEDLKTLFAGGIINDATSHNLETLIVSGIQANNGVDIPSDYVKKALSVLEEELKVVFADEVKLGATESEKERAESNAEKKDDPSFVYEEDDENVVKQGYEDDSDEPAFINKDGDVDFRVKERLRKEEFTKTAMHDKRKISKLIAIIIPIVLIIIIAIIIKSCVSGGGDKKNAQKYVPETTEEIIITESPTEEIIITEPPTTSEAGMYNVTGDRVWIRDQATTTSRRIAGVDKGDQVRVIRFYDDDWAIINYDGKEAFISRKFIVRAEGGEEVPPEVIPQ